MSNSETITLSETAKILFACEGTLEQKVTLYLHQLGLPANIKGYPYIRKAIMLACDDLSIVNHITKQVYPIIASQYLTTVSIVERSMRHAVEVVWKRGNKRLLNEVFSPALEKRPSNSEFIAMVADYLIVHLK